MKTPELTPSSEETSTIIIGANQSIIIDETIKQIDFSMHRDMESSWPDDLSTSFAVSEGKFFWYLTEINEDKPEEELVVIRHRKNKEINTRSFLETDMLRSDKEKKVAIAAGGFVALIAAGAAATFLVVHKRKK